MKFSVGYQLCESDEISFVSIVEKYKDSIAEVYFPWVQTSSGRGDIADNDGYTNWDAVNVLVRDLKKIKSIGIKTDLLLNGNCYGADAMSENLKNKIASILDYLIKCDIPADVVTTTSPAIAHMIKSTHPETEVRASVNMRIGTVKGMEYVAHLFDSYYICRDFNRDFDRIKEMKAWTDKYGKKLYMIANSGCMRECSFQTFHDNLVSHNSEVYKVKNISDFMPYACWNLLKYPENRVSVLQNTWIRPEDVKNYEPYFDMMKLATRTHNLPMVVISAYASGKYGGNLLDLFEPGYGPAFAPYILDNTRFPSDWFERTSACDKKCENCNYCRQVLDKIIRIG